MPTNLTVNNNTYAYPVDNDEPGWGGPATGWAVEVTGVLQTIAGTNDIFETTFNVANNISSVADVTGLLFNPSLVRSAVVEYSLYIHTSSSELAEKGTLDLIYKNGGNVGSKWSIGRVFFGDNAGVTFTMTDAGQIQYTSSNVAGTSYTGIMHFTATVTLQ